MRPLDFANLYVPKLGLASFRGRFILRGVFLVLMLATLALALKLLTEEKQRSHLIYAQSIQKSQSEILAKLRHPAGQLALLNPERQSQNPTPLRPLLLPYAAIDFDDQNKAQQAVEMAGCLMHYKNHGDVCVAIGNNPYAGGFIYIVGNFLSGELVGRERGALELEGVHRARVTLTMRGQTTRWIAPFEAIYDPDATSVRGRLTGFVESGSVLAANAKPVRDFRGWLWQGKQCVSETSNCLRASFFSIRLPVEMFREDLFQKPRVVWPPKDLNQIQVQVEIFSPNTVEPVFDSNGPGTTPPFALSDLANSLQAGEILRIRKLDGSARDIISLQGRDEGEDHAPRWIKQIIQQLPIDGEQPVMRAQETLHTSLGSYEVTLTGDASATDRSLSAVTTRVSWYVGTMLGAIVLAWLLIEMSFLRRVAILTKRAAAVSYNVQDHHDAKLEKRISALDLSDLRGSDELGILAGGLSDLLQRVKDDVQREQIRAQQERDMWHAVGHEIMSPLQSLMVLHPHQEDTSHRYIQRMQQAVRVLYGSASPSEALEAATLQLDTIDLNEFLANIADNAHFAGLEDVRFERATHPVMIRADEFSLEDVVTHILRNADRYRIQGTPVSIKMEPDATTVSVMIHNLGSSIDSSMLDRIFEYGVSDPDNPGNGEHRGQGLFVAKTYMAKMGGTISAKNAEGGVIFTLTLQRVG